MQCCHPGTDAHTWCLRGSKPYGKLSSALSDSGGTPCSLAQNCSRTGGGRPSGNTPGCSWSLPVQYPGQDAPSSRELTLALPAPGSYLVQCTVVTRGCPWNHVPSPSWPEDVKSPILVMEAAGASPGPGVGMLGEGDQR